MSEHITLIKVCSQCRQALPVVNFWYRNEAKDKLASRCKSCHNAARRADRAARPNHYREIAKKYRSGNPADYLRHLCTHALIRAGKKGIAFALTRDWLLEQYRLQAGRCYWSGVAMTCVRNQGKVATNISLDRIDPASGYTQENVVLVCWWVNAAKSTGTIDDLLAWAEVIRAYQKEQRYAKGI